MDTKLEPEEETSRFPPPSEGREVNFLKGAGGGILSFAGGVTWIPF